MTTLHEAIAEMQQFLEDNPHAADWPICIIRGEPEAGGWEDNELDLFLNINQEVRL